jgi:DNA-binding GntR family transcriptional regulator
MAQDRMPDSGYGSRTEDAVAVVRDMITSGQLKPGEHLRQDHLALQIGVTRVPMREAFKTLVAEGVLIHKRNHGHYVATLSSGELRQMMWLRETLEDELIRTAEWPSPDGVEKLRAINAELGAFASGAQEYNYVRVTATDRDFHTALWQLSPMEIIVNEVSRVWRMTEPYHLFMPLSRPEAVHRSVDEHSRIIDAIEANDRDSYRVALVSHRNNAWPIVAALARTEQERAGLLPD